MPLFLSVENQNVGIGVVMYKNDHFFKSKSFHMQIGTKRTVVSAGLTDKRILDHIKFNIMTKVKDQMYRCHMCLCDLTLSSNNDFKTMKMGYM